MNKMAYLPTIEELTFVGAFDRGKPNDERIVLRPTRPVNLAEYIACLSVQSPNGQIIPLQNQMFWFSEEIVEPPAWIFLYTGSGTRRITKTQQSGETALVLHWGHRQTVLQDERVTPVVFRLGGLLTPTSKSLLQLLFAGARPVEGELTARGTTEEIFKHFLLKQLEKGSGEA